MWSVPYNWFFQDHPELEALREKNYVARFPKIHGYPHIFILAANGTLSEAKLEIYLL